MPSNSDSQCYFVQLQIDSYLDGELNEVQQGVFMSHVEACAACANEFHYAQTVQDSIMELPQIECNELVLEPIDRLLGAEMQTVEAQKQESFAARLAAMLNSVPLYFRYGFSAAAVAVIALLVGFGVMTPAQGPAPVLVSGSAEQYTPEDISQALEELNIAIDYLNQLSQRTEVMIGERFLVNPIQDSLNASFERAGTRENDPLQNDPI